MTRDEEWWAKFEKRRAEVWAKVEESDRQVEEERRKYEEEAAARRAEREREALSPVRRRHAGGAVSYIATMLILALIAFVFGELAMTVGQFTGQDIDEAKRLGRATVVSCERHGPVGEGLGYWDECSADVVWDGGQRETLTIDKRGFFQAKEIGTTVTIGDFGYYKGGRSFARKELPSRPLVTLVAAVFLIIAVLPLMAMVWLLWNSLRNGLRRLMGKPVNDG